MDDSMTVADVADRLNVSERTVRRWIAEGALPATKIVGRVRISGADVDALSRNVFADK